MPIGIVWISNGFAFPQRYPDWVFLLNQIPPSSAFITGLNAVMPGEIGAPSGANGAANIDAVYATPWVGIVMLAVWLVLPLAIGYWRFTNADL